MADHLTREQRSRLMSRVRTKDTAPEVALRQALWRSGVRGWRLHGRLPGRPDLVFGPARVAVFVDGAFWHGHPEYYRGQSGQFWDDKIARNRRRDELVNEQLAHLGWRVVRLWDFEVKADPAECIAKINAALEAGLTDVRRHG